MTASIEYFQCTIMHLLEPPGVLLVVSLEALELLLLLLLKKQRSRRAPPVQLLGVGCWVLGVGRWALGVGRWVLGVGLGVG